MKNYVLMLASSLCLGWAASAQSALTFWKSGDLMIVYGTIDQGDVEKVKRELTTAIKTVVIRAPLGMNFRAARDVAKVIEDAEVTTVAHGNCTELVCPMLFLSGKRRMFSGAGPASAHTLTIGIGEPTHVLSDDSGVKIETIHEWWREHTKLTRSDVSLSRDGFFSTTGNTSKFDRKVFFPAQAKFSKGNVLHCSGTAKSQQLVDCRPVPDATALSKGIVTTDELFVDSRLTEASDVAVPAPTNLVALDAGQTLLASDRCKEIYRDYLKQDLPRAFVVSNKEGCHWASIGIRPFERAMKACEKEVLAGKECRFYSVDNGIVFTPFEQAQPPAVIATKSEVARAKVVSLDQSNTSLLLARNATAEDGPSGVNDRFSVEGKIIAYLTFKWDADNAPSGAQRVEVRWFSGDKLVSSQQSEFVLSASPHRIWMPVLSADIGAGKNRVDVFANGTLIASKPFEIVEKL
ncbi:MAG TPA: hypothetical protein VLC92_06180 [Rhodocyclaceae bacterium]|nr:hypothetical protein [Rhodocyclaceae bacterium]